MTNFVLMLVVVMMLMVTGIIHMIVSEIQVRRLAAHVEQSIVGGITLGLPFVGLLDRLRWLGEWTRRFYTSTNLDNIRNVIQASGFNPHQMLPVLLGTKMILTLVILIVTVVTACLVGSMEIKFTAVGIGLVLGVLGPEWILGFVRSRFTAAVRRGTPDALDLLVVCSEAGMGLEFALERVAQEIQHTNRPMSTVLFSLLDDIRVLPNRRDAFTNIGTRSGVDGLRRFGTMLSQSLEYGTPISHAIRTVAEDLRRERMVKLEEIAVKLPAKLIFPMIFLIMPSLFIVLLGAPFMRIGSIMTMLLHK
jgi:tight adherence protein C